MGDSSRHEHPGWSFAVFPSRSLRSSFLEQVRQWSFVECLAPVAAEPLLDGRHVRFRTGPGPGDWVLRLIESFGGREIGGHAAAPPHGVSARA